MPAASITQAHIACEAIGENNPEVLVIEFLSPDIAGPVQARDLAEQLDSLIRPGLPHNFVIDFARARSLGSTAFGEIAHFVRRAGRVRVCNLGRMIRLGASLIGLDDQVEFSPSRPQAIRAARRDWRRGEEDTVDYPDVRSWGRRQESIRA
jgi:anti-anti-sigma regulatory factor